MPHVAFSVFEAAKVGKRLRDSSKLRGIIRADGSSGFGVPMHYPKAGS